MRNIILKLEYDGTNYSGWQRQNNAVTVQELLEKSLYELLGKETKVTGCSRTDAGVHALGFVCNFYTDSKIPADKFPYALNRILPDDIVVLEGREGEEGFHARYHALGKKYRYRIYNHIFPSAVHRNYTWHNPYDLDVQKMKRAANYFIGQHDFSAFMASGSSVKDTVRNVTLLTVEKQGVELIIEIAANGFLYNMVRIIAGTLVEVGKGKIAAELIPEIIQSKERKKAAATAPPQGLYLVEVYY